MCYHRDTHSLQDLIKQAEDAVRSVSKGDDTSARSSSVSRRTGALERSKSQSNLDAGPGPSAFALSIGSPERQRLMRAITSVSPRDDATELVPISFASGQKASLRLRDPSERTRTRIEKELDEMEQAAMYAGLPHFTWKVWLSEATIFVSVTSS